ncbi:hypothetical protein [Brachybacterium hainanense]|uniref:Uncharacterized protein n=1 Tax=Brachybacterium hainanense TaxID=1541174 RepID=A0ABV6RBL4_9MICO
MSTLEDAILARRPDWGPLPAELGEALDWMQERGHAIRSGGVEYATPYPGPAQQGVVFRSDLTLGGWLEDGSDPAVPLLPIADADGAGGILALWRRDGLVADAVVLINDLDAIIVADSALDLLRLIAIGHDELRGAVLGEEPPAESAAAHAAFRAWVQDRFAVDVPEAWDVDSGDEFTSWWQERTGQASPPPRGITENADADAGRVTVSGPVTVLLGILGAADGPEPAAAVGALLGIDAGPALKSGTRRTKKRGLEARVEKGTVTTIFVHIGLAAEGLFGTAPIEYPWWQGPDLIDGLPHTSTMADALALLGDPERTGKHHARYRVGEAFMNISFGPGGISQITLMTEVP